MGIGILSKRAKLKSDFDNPENKDWFGFVERRRWQYLYTTNWELVHYEDVEKEIGKVRRHMKRVSKDVKEAEEEALEKKNKGEEVPEGVWKKLKFLEEMEKKITEVQAVLDEKLREGPEHSSEESPVVAEA